VAIRPRSLTKSLPRVALEDDENLHEAEIQILYESLARYAWYTMYAIRRSVYIAHSRGHTHTTFILFFPLLFVFVRLL
jgi:hypothetical protein